MALSFVQGTGNTSGSANSIARAFVSNVSVGNRIVVAITTYYITTNPVTSVTDNLGNTYTLVNSNNSTGYGWYVHIYSAPVTTGGACTVTVNLTDSLQVGLAIAESAGNSTSVDVSNNAGPTYSTTPQVGLSPTVENIIFAVSAGNWSSSPTVTPDSGWTQIYENENWATMVISFIYRIVPSGSATAGWTLSLTQYWSAVAGGFREAAGGGGAKFPTPHLWWSEA